MGTPWCDSAGAFRPVAYQRTPTSRHDKKADKVKVVKKEESEQWAASAKGRERGCCGRRHVHRPTSVMALPSNGVRRSRAGIATADSGSSARRRRSNTLIRASSRGEAWLSRLGRGGRLRVPS